MHPLTWVENATVSRHLLMLPTCAKSVTFSTLILTLRCFFTQKKKTTFFNSLRTIRVTLTSCLFICVYTLHAYVLSYFVVVLMTIRLYKTLSFAYENSTTIYAFALRMYSFIMNSQWDTTSSVTRFVLGLLSRKYFFFTYVNICQHLIFTKRIL